MKHPAVLLVEDMQLVSKEENLRAWKEMNKEQLRELFLIIRDAGGSSYRADNIWMSRNGKFSFVDTEYPKKEGNFATVARFLSKENKQFWNNLIKSK